MDLGEVRCGDVYWWRKRWRAVVDSVMNIRVT
jgi:hypothetical protein